MTHKGIKAALILGSITLAILGFCAFQQGILSRHQKGDGALGEGQAVAPDVEARLTAQLAEMSGNKGYDSWSAQKKASFRAEQLRVLESLKNK